MNKGIYFILGAAVGSVCTWLFLKGKYERLAQEEIDSVKETFTKDMDRLCHLRDDASEALNTYTIKNDIPFDSAYVIAPDQFGEFPDYNQVCVKYYSGDGIILSETGDILSDINGITEEDFIDHFGEYEYEDDTVYFRDDMRCCDYEILRVPGCYNGEDDDS